MSEVYAYLFVLIASVLVQNTIALSREGLVNPVFLFSAINYLHNWSASFAELMFPDFSRGVVLIQVTDSLWAKTLQMALVAQWVFFVIFLYFSQRKQTSGLGGDEIIMLMRRTNVQGMKILYVCLLLCFIVFSFAFGSRGAYGSGIQASDASLAFTPLQILFGLRVFVLGMILIRDGLCGEKRFAILSLLSEAALATLSGGRKMVFLAFLMYLFAVLLKSGRVKWIKPKFGKTILILILSGVFGIFLVVYVLRVRSGEGVVEAALSTLGMMIEQPGYLFAALASSNSQALQAWVIDLVDSGGIAPLYGRSYVQAVINMVILRPFQGDIVDWQAAYAFKTVAYPHINNHGWDFCFAGETYLNFKNFYWIPYLVFAIVMNKLFYSRFESVFKLFLTIGLWAICFVAFRSDSTALFRHLSMFLAVFFIFNYWFKWKKNSLLLRSP